MESGPMNAVRPNILVVEDEIIIGKDIQSCLEDMGYGVAGVVSTGAQAMEKAALEQPDLILMDIQIKGPMDGIETAEQIRDKYGIPVIFLSSHADDDRLDRATRAEPFGYLIKPFITRELRAGIEMALYKANIEAKRKQTESALRKSEEKFLIMAENIQEIFWMTSPESREIVYISPGFEKIWQIPVKALHENSRLWMESIHPDDIGSVKKNQQKQAAGQTTEEEFRIVLPDDSIKWIANSAYPIKGEDGRVNMIAGVAQNITEKKEALEKNIQLEARLGRSQKMEAIATLAGGIAHDFNNILFPIIGYAEISMDELQEDNPVRDNLNQILKAAMRARDLVGQILAFSRQTENTKKPLRLEIILKEVLKLVRSTLPTTIGIHQNIDKGCESVLAEADKIHQVIMNLITNAFHAMEQTGGRLDVSLKKVDLSHDDLKELHMNPGPYMCLKVTDTGTGMKKAVLDKIFDPYFTTKPQNKGTGLGLAVVRGIVTSYGGAITAYSEPGKGTAFNVYLPCVDTASNVYEKIPGPNIKKGNERILLVDDEPSIVVMQTRMLEKLGYQVTGKTSSLEALEEFKSQPDIFDLVITDMTMPQMAGIHLAAKILQIRENTPIILCTGYSEQIDEQTAKKIGIRKFILKPIIQKELTDKIRQALDR